MALHGPIQVNGMTIGEWSAVRKTFIGQEPEPDDAVEYECMVRQDSTLEGNPAVLERFTVTHRFGDGALGLASTCIARALVQANQQ